VSVTRWELSKLSEDKKSNLPESIKLDAAENLIDVVVNSGTPAEKIIQLPVQALTPNDSNAVVVKKEPTWSKKERRILNLLAVLGLVNLLAYFITQNSFIMQNIYWVYGIITTLDGISFLALVAVYDDNKKRHFKLAMTPCFKGGLVAMGLWLISIPVVVISYYLPVIPFTLMDVANVAWGISIALSAAYNTMYVMVVVGSWLVKGMELE